MGWSSALVLRFPSGLGRQIAPGVPLGLLAAGLLLRVALSPLNHTWDSQTWLNVAAQLGREPNPLRAVTAPFERAAELTLLARGSGQGQYYEYWAYPPTMLFVWWPVARAWHSLAGELPEEFAAPGAFTARPLPLGLSFALKIPTMVADVAVASMLARMVSPTLARWYLLNPYFLLVGLWTFDSVALAFLLGGLRAAMAGRWAWAGALLALGTGVKYTPALLMLAVVLQALREPRPLSPVIKTLGAFGVVTLVAFLPALDGVRETIQFHGGRHGGGIAWQSVWDVVYWSNPLADLAPVLLYISPQVGALTLGTAVLATTWLAHIRRLDLTETSLALMLGFLAGSKLVNEVYPLHAAVLAAIVAAKRPNPATLVLARALWIVPLAFAVVNVPAWGFLLAPAEALGLTTLEAARQFHLAYVLTYAQLAPVLALTGGAFQIMCLCGVWLVTRIHSSPPSGRLGASEVRG